MLSLDKLKKRKEAYTQVFSTPLGQEVLKDLMHFCKVYEPTYVPGDPETTAYNEGARRVVLRILSLMHKDPAKQFEIINNMMRDDNE
jgi:hypothetical protein